MDKSVTLLGVADLSKEQAEDPLGQEEKV